MGTTPIYGFPYPDPSDLVANYPALGQQLAEDIEDVLPTIGGLAPATPTTIANSGGSSSLSSNTVTFTGVTSISLNGCFTSDYTNYRILVAGTGSTNVDLALRLRAAGSDATGTDYLSRNLLAFSGGISSNESTTASWENLARVNTDAGCGVIDLFRPQLAVKTAMNNQGGTSVVTQIRNGHHNLANAYDGFTLTANTGNMTGIVSVYGYRK